MNNINLYIIIILAQVATLVMAASHDGFALAFELESVWPAIRLQMLAYFRALKLLLS